MDRSKGMLGTFAPQREPYVHTLEEETTPSGMLARGKYTAKLRVGSFKFICYAVFCSLLKGRFAPSVMSDIKHGERRHIWRLSFLIRCQRNEFCLHLWCAQKHAIVHAFSFVFHVA